MAQTLPFSALLDVLRARGFEIGLIEYRDLATLLSRYQGQSREELRHAVAALFARDQGEWQAIADCYDELYPPETVAPPPLPPPPPADEDGRTRTVRAPWTARTKILTGIAGLLIAVLLTPLVIARLTPAPKPKPRVETVVPPPDPGTNPPVPSAPAPEPPPEPQETRWASLLLPGSVSFAALLLLATAFRTSGRRDRWRRTVRRAGLAAISGPRFYRWPVDHRAMAIPRHVVEEMATILGRRHEVARTGNHLDVRMTVRRTLDAGLFPRIVFEPPCRTRPVLVLHDICPEMRPWRSRVDLLLRDLNRIGIPIRRFYFDASARTLWRSDTDSTMTLEELSRSEDDAALMVISTGAGVAAAVAEDTRSWLRTLEKWSSRTWVTPLTSRAHWRGELTQVPMSVWPMTPGGLNAAARDLLFDSSHRTSAPPSALAGARAVNQDDLERVKRLVAVVPQPAPVEVVDALRARFTPDVPPDVLLPLLVENDVLDSAHVRLAPDEIKRLLAALRRDNPERETAVRRFLLDLLASTEPPADTAAHLRWQTEVLLQHAQLVEMAGGDPAQSIEALQMLAAGPLAEEVGTRVGAVAASGRLSGPLEQVAKSSRSAVTVTTSVIPKPRLARPRAVDLLLTSAATAAAIGIFVLAGGLRAETIEHVRNAFRLEWDANTGRLRMTIANPAAAAQYGSTNLTRDREVVDRFTWNGVRLFTPRPEQRGAWYQVASPLPQGNMALSNAVWVPAPAPPRPPAQTTDVADNVPTTPDVPAAGSRRTLEIRLTDVYGGPLTRADGRISVRDKTGAAIGTSPVTNGTASLGVTTVGPYRVSVSTQNYEPAAFTVPDAAAAKPVTRSLIVPRSEIGGVQGLPKDFKGMALPNAGADETMGMLNALQRADRTTLTLERPQGTWSSTLFGVIERLTTKEDVGVTGFVKRDNEAYVETWFRLRRPAAAGRNLNVGYQAQQAAPAYAPMTASIRAGQTILDVRLLSGGPPILGVTAMTVDMSVRRASDGTSDPFIIHQLLVQDGYPPLYRLRFGAPPASAK